MQRRPEVRPSWRSSHLTGRFYCKDFFFAGAGSVVVDDTSYVLCREIPQELDMILKKREKLNANLRIFGDLDALQYSAEKTRAHLEVCLPTFATPSCHCNFVYNDNTTSLYRGYGICI